jgi:hypothetical protein
MNTLKNICLKSVVNYKDLSGLIADLVEEVYALRKAETLKEMSVAVQSWTGDDLEDYHYTINISGLNYVGRKWSVRGPRRKYCRYCGGYLGRQIQFEDRIDTENCKNCYFL